MNTFNSSFVTEMTKLAQPGSGMSPLAKALALGGAGVGAYGLYKAHAANQAAQQAAAAAAASKSRMKTLLGLGLLGGGAAAAHHFGLDAGILEKLKGLFGGGAAEAASAAPAAAATAAAPEAAANPLMSAAKGGKTILSNIIEKAKAGHFTAPDYAEMPATPQAIQHGVDGLKYHGETGDVFFPQKGLLPGQAGTPGMSQYYYGADPSNPLMPSPAQIEAGNKFVLDPKIPLTSEGRMLQYERLTKPGFMGTLKNFFGAKPEALIR
jgi:hypothetical protein